MKNFLFFFSGGGKLMDLGMDIESFLRLATCGGLKDIQRAAVAFGINAHDEDGVTALMTASSAGRQDVVSWLIESKADVNARDSHGFTSFHVAASQGRAKILKLLTPHTDREFQNSTDIDGRVPLHLAIINNHLSVVRLLAGNPFVDLNSRDKSGGTPVHLAAALGHVHILRLLFDHPMVNVHALEDDGTNALHLAAAYNRMATLSFLAGSGLYDLNAKTNEGATALHLACMSGHLVIARYLFTRTTLGADVDGDTELHLAVRSVSVTRFLLAQGQHDPGALTRDGSTALHRAVGLEHIHFGVVKALVGAKAPLHIKDDMGATPLQAACHSGNVSIVRFLLESKSNTNEVDNDGFAPLHAAAQNGHLKLVRFLVDSCRCDVNVCSRKGSTPLICALRFAHHKVAKWLVVRGKADVHQQSMFGTPIEVARRFEHLGPEAVALSAWLSRPCGHAACPRRGSKKCGGCFKMRYCSAECQVQSWATHKEHCVLSL